MFFLSQHLLLLVAHSFATTAYVLDNTLATSRNFDSGLQLLRRDLPAGTCNATTPCTNGACCGSNGVCGYAPAECGTGCTSNCNATAECGQYGAVGSQTCPLDVCCSEYGFCGDTSDFCGTGCQSGYGTCGDAPQPSCSSPNVGSRTIGYYESWSSSRTCESVQPGDLNLTGFTHVNFAFALFDPTTFQISPMDANSTALYKPFTTLKTKYTGLQTWISVGGSSFTGFSGMTNSSTNRSQFITSLLSFMTSYGFDGVDLDWEYPSANDVANYVSLTKELRAALGSKGLSLTLPASYYNLQYFDVASMQQYVDWFNFMAYDLHGTWDVPAYIAPHTNLTEIDQGLNLLWRAGVNASQVVLGEAWYGRSFTLKDSSCNTPNGVCMFTSGGNAGQCSATSGILDDEEIATIISQNNLLPTWDQTAGVKWITWNSNQWVSYDDADTIAQKRSFASSRCLGGQMVWAIDEKNQSTPNPLGLSGATTSIVSTSTTTSQPTSTTLVVSPTQSGIVANCNQYLMANPGGSCTAFASRAGITLAQLYAWNAVLGVNGANCSTEFWGNEYYCVGVSTTSTTTAPSTTTTSTTSAATAPGPTQSGIVSNCNSYLMANSGGSCTTFASRAGITLAQLYAWNAVLGVNGANCSTEFWGNEYYCVGVSAISTTVPSTTSSSATTIVTAPGPTQTGIVSNCNTYLMANSGGTCTLFADRAGITLAQLYAWNAVLGSNGENCSTEFWANEYYCVGVSGTNAAVVVAPKTTSTSKSTSTTKVTAPGPTQTGIVAKCNKYLMANPGGSCTVFAGRAGITTAQLYSWNPVLGVSGASCSTNFWANEYYCVGVSN